MPDKFTALARGTPRPRLTCASVLYKNTVSRVASMIPHSPRNSPPGAPPPPLRSVRLLDQVRERIRYGRYGLK